MLALSIKKVTFNILNFALKLGDPFKESLKPSSNEK